MLSTSRKRVPLLELSRGLDPGRRFASLHSRFEACARGIGAFTRRRQKAYFGDREAELQELIALLIQALADLSFENREHNRRILEHSRRMQAILRSADRQRPDAALMEETAELQAMVRDKEAREDEKVEMLSHQLSALDNHFERLCTEAEHDRLTGTLSRRTFDTRLDDLIGGKREKPKWVSLLMIDIDDFKRINDIHGYVAGDRALIMVADICRKAVPAGCEVARYGGEEFAILLPEVSVPDAIRKGWEICEAVASNGCRLEGISSRELLRLTVSIGVSSSRMHESAGLLVDRANQALRLAKHAGKNRVMAENDIDSWHPNSSMDMRSQVLR